MPCYAHLPGRSGSTAAHANLTPHASCVNLPTCLHEALQRLCLSQWTRACFKLARGHKLQQPRLTLHNYRCRKTKAH